MRTEDIKLAASISGLYIAAIMIVTAFIFAAVTTAAFINADTLRSAGYDAKVINLACMAKFHGRYVGCDAIFKNQVEVVKD